MDGNRTIFQAFEWNAPGDRQHWNRLLHVLPRLKEIGINNIWLPPACKGGSPMSNCYDIYDPFDLGEFKQKGSRSTKWGCKEDLLRLSQEAKRLGVGLYFDAVLNHRCGGDGTVKVPAVMVDPQDRTKIISRPIQIDAWLNFDFPGRNNAYSPFKLTWQQFNATDYDQASHKKGIFKLIADGKDWADDVDKSEFGNNDYLLLNNLDYSNRPLREEMKYWGTWIVNELGLSGFRLDAAQHISLGFLNEWMTHIDTAVGHKLLYIGEFWSGNLPVLLSWLARSPSSYHLFDVPLFYNIANVSWAEYPDLRGIFANTLVQSAPKNAVTLVMNHDTQKGQTMEQPLNHLFVPHAYALILLREAGTPCVFYGDLFGICDPFPSPPTGYGKLADLILARKLYAHGSQTDYFDRPECVGWVRMGKKGYVGTSGSSGFSGSSSSSISATSSVSGGPETAGMAVVLSWVGKESLQPRPSPEALRDLMEMVETGRVSGGDGASVRERLRKSFHLSRRSWSGLGSMREEHAAVPVVAQRSALVQARRKRMFVGKQRAGEVWRDLLGWEQEDVIIDAEGFGVFGCQKNKMAVFVSARAPGRERFPVNFDSDIYNMSI